jgi:hypothetical protein
MIDAVEIPSEPLSPELVLVSSPEVAAAARGALSPLALSTICAAQPPARRSSIRRVAGLAAFYGAALAVTATPLYLTLQTVPSR